MTIASEITKLNTNLTNSYTACQGKGATIPSDQNFDNLATCISSISGGGSSPVITSLNVTPTTSAQTITAPSGTDGYSPVNVSAVTSSIDANITAGNIKNGVSILGVTGNYTGSATLITKNITANGTYNASSDNADGYSSVTVNVSGGGTKYGATGGTFLGNVDANGVLSYDSNTPTDLVFTGVRDLGDYALSFRFTYTKTKASNSMARANFLGLNSIKSASFPDLENITGNYAMDCTFQGCTGLTSVDLSSLTTISGTSGMEYAFSGCTGLTSVDLSSLTTISGTSGMYYAFQNCTGLISIDLSSLTTMGQRGIYYAFTDCTSLSSVDLSSLTSINSSYVIAYAFRNCTSLTTLSFPSLNSNSFSNATNQFNNMLKGVTGCTVHFPSNLQSVIGSWKDVTSGFGGTNTTVLFDLPATT